MHDKPLQIANANMGNLMRQFCMDGIKTLALVSAVDPKERAWV